jgi:hypothetical protein
MSNSFKGNGQHIEDDVETLLLKLQQKGKNVKIVTDEEEKKGSNGHKKSIKE